MQTPMNHVRPRNHRFDDFVERRWLDLPSLTTRPDALASRPVPEDDSRSIDQENRINQLGLGAGLAVWVLGAMAAVHVITERLATPGIALFAYVATMFVGALLPRWVSRKIGEYSDRGAIGALADEHGLTMKVLGAVSNRSRAAWGTIDDAPVCVMLRRNVEAWPANHVYVATDCPGIATMIQWRQPARRLLDRRRRVDIEGLELEGKLEVLVRDGANTFERLDALTLIDGDVAERLIRILLVDAVVRVTDERLEVFLNTVDHPPATLAGVVGTLLAIRKRLGELATLSVQDRLLHAVMNAAYDRREHCLNTLRWAFPESEQRRAAEDFVKSHAPGQLTLCEAEGGAVSLVEEAGALKLCER